MKRLLLVLLSIILLCGLVFGCTKSTSTSPAVQTTTQPAAAKVYTGIYTYYDVAFQDYAERFVDDVNTMSNGQLVLTAMLESSLGDLSEGLLNLGKGLFQCGRFAPGYSAGLDPALMFCGGNNFDILWTSLYDEIELEFKYGMNDIYQEKVYDKLNIKMIWPVFFPRENLVSNVPVYTLDDMKGMKIRSFGQMANTFAAFGAATTMFPGSEIYTNLSSHLVDGATYDSPYIMYKLGLADVTKYWTQSLFPYGSTYHFANIDWWNSLPDNLKKIFEIASANASYQNYYEMKDMDAYAFKEAAKQGVTVITWSDEDMERFANTYVKVVTGDMVRTNAVIAECWEIMKQFLTDKGRPIPDI